MSCTRLKRRSRIYHLCLAKSLGRKPSSLRTTDKSAAQEIQRRVESGVWADEHGIKRQVTERLRCSDLVRRFIEHKRDAGVSAHGEFPEGCQERGASSEHYIPQLAAHFRSLVGSGGSGL
jgi:hypothetical protein